ncbi:MAG: hypothetical protein HYU88_14020, partial [Chloroflexi bacterium]|nr:hypothetical protein [Chloroflexota bacterium]
SFPCPSWRGSSSRFLQPGPDFRGRRCWPGCWNGKPNAHGPADLTGPVRITHPFHPLYGQAIDLVSQRTEWGDERVYYRDRQGHRRTIPTQWTSLAPDDPYIALGAGRSLFRAQDLIDLAALIEGPRT